MSEEQIANAFQSFFSTKDTGTGLGLVLVQTVVEEHQGSISVESQQAVGTRFIIDLNVLANEGHPAISYSTYSPKQNLRTSM